MAERSAFQRLVDAMMAPATPPPGVDLPPGWEWEQIGDERYPIFPVENLPPAG